MIEVKIDRAKILEQCEGDEEILNILVTEFGSAIGTVVEELKKAYDLKDSETFERAAHTLKSNLSYFYVTDLVNRALFLEQKGNADELEDIEDKVSEMLLLVKEFQKQLETLL